MKNKKYLSISVGVLLVFIFGVIVYFQIKGNEKMKMLEQKIVDLSSLSNVGTEGTGGGAGNIEYHRINAYVQEVKNNKILVKVVRLHFSDSSELDNRIIEIDEKTVFRQLRERDESEKNDNTGYETFERKEISLTDLKKSDYIEIVAEENIEKSKQFKASEIIVWKIIAKKS